MEQEKLQEEVQAQKAAQAELAPEYDNHDDLDLRGTMFSVSILGIVFVVLWIAIFILFISRL